MLMDNRHKIKMTNLKDEIEGKYLVNIMSDLPHILDSEPSHNHRLLSRVSHDMYHR